MLSILKDIESPALVALPQNILPAKKLSGGWRIQCNQTAAIIARTKNETVLYFPELALYRALLTTRRSIRSLLATGRFTFRCFTWGRLCPSLPVDSSTSTLHRLR